MGRVMREKHGESYQAGRTPEYAAWINMIQRCENPRVRHYERYGGRGIRVCARWRRSFSAFLEDVGRRPTSAHSLDRHPRPSGNYEPGNVRWATEQQQQRNRSTNRTITAKGETKCLGEWAEATGIKRETIARRINSGMSPEEALARPATEPVRHPFQGQMLTTREIARLLAIPYNSLLRRIKRHGSVTEAAAHWSANRRGKRPAQSSASRMHRSGQ